MLTKYNKGNKQRLFNKLLGNDIITCFVNEVVVSEFLYHFVSHNASHSPLALTEVRKIHKAFDNSQ